MKHDFEIYFYEKRKFKIEKKNFEKENDVDVKKKQI